MSFIGVVMAFGYKGKLPGTVIDMYRCSLFMERVSKLDKIYYITDIIHDPRISDLLPAIIDGIVDAQIIEFIPKIQKNDYYYTDDESKLISSLESLPKSAGCMFYYSGHGKDNSFILPSGERFPIERLEGILNRMNKENFYIFDCCSIKIKPDPLSKYLVASYDLNHLTTSTSIGSQFTRIIFSLIKPSMTEMKREFNALRLEDTQLYTYGETIFEWVFGKRVRVVLINGVYYIETLC